MALTCVTSWSVNMAHAKLVPPCCMCSSNVIASSKRSRPNMIRRTSSTNENRWCSFWKLLRTRPPTSSNIDAKGKKNLCAQSQAVKAPNEAIVELGKEIHSKLDIIQLDVAGLKLHTTPDPGLKAASNFDHSDHSGHTLDHPPGPRSRLPGGSPMSKLTLEEPSLVLQECQR